MKILITGGCGFVGSNIAIFLKKKLKNTVISSLDNLSRTGSELNKKRLLPLEFLLCLVWPICYIGRSSSIRLVEDNMLIFASLPSDFSCDEAHQRSQLYRTGSRVHRVVIYQLAYISGCRNPTPQSSSEHRLNLTG